MGFLEWLAFALLKKDEGPVYQDDKWILEMRRKTTGPPFPKDITDKVPASQWHYLEFGDELKNGDVCDCGNYCFAIGTKEAMFKEGDKVSNYILRYAPYRRICPQTGYERAQSGDNPQAKVPPQDCSKTDKTRLKELLERKNPTPAEREEIGRLLGKFESVVVFLDDQKEL